MPLSVQANGIGKTRSSSEEVPAMVYAGLGQKPEALQ
jgi:hypothetical protein